MITFELVTLTGVKMSEDVYEVVVPTPDGHIGVFPDHMSLVSLADNGVISIRRLKSHSDDQMEHYATNGGVVEVSKHRIRVLADEAEHSDEISEKEVKEALEKAKSMAKDAKDQVSLDRAQSMIQASQNRLRVAELKNRRRSR